jgi:arylsulfatase A-like enzyme
MLAVGTPRILERQHHGAGTALLTRQTKLTIHTALTIHTKLTIHTALTIHYTHFKLLAQTPLANALAREWRRGYYAAVRYTDSLVGALMQGLDDLEQRDSTVVVFNADHGEC